MGFAAPLQCVYQPRLICKNSVQCGSAHHTVVGDAHGIAFMVAVECICHVSMAQAFSRECFQAAINFALVMLAGSYS